MSPLKPLPPPSWSRVQADTLRLVSAPASPPSLHPQLRPRPRTRLRLPLWNLGNVRAVGYTGTAADMWTDKRREAKGAREGRGLSWTRCSGLCSSKIAAITSRESDPTVPPCLRDELGPFSTNISGNFDSWEFSKAESSHTRKLALWLVLKLKLIESGIVRQGGVARRGRRVEV